MRAFVKIRNLLYSLPRQIAHGANFALAKLFDGVNKDLAEKVEKMKREIGRIFEILNKMRQPENDKKEEIGFKG